MKNIHVLLRIGSAVLLLSMSMRGYANEPVSQICWTFGKFDASVYFAEAEIGDDRKDSFDELLTASGIDHHETKCLLSRSNRERLAELKAIWLEQKLEVINTTFLSDLDY